MSNSTHIKDSFGNQIPMLDAYGNLSQETIMLYSEDKLNEEDRKLVDAFAANDKIGRDALDGFALAGNATQIRSHLNDLTKQIQTRSGSVPLPIGSFKESQFDHRKLAAGIAILLTLGAGSYFTVRYFQNDQLADATLVNDVAEEERNSRNGAQEQSPTILYETKVDPPTDRKTEVLQDEASRSVETATGAVKTEKAVEVDNLAGNARQETAPEPIAAKGEAPSKETETMVTPAESTTVALADQQTKDQQKANNQGADMDGGLMVADEQPEAAEEEVTAYEAEDSESDADKKRTAMGEMAAMNVASSEKKREETARTQSLAQNAKMDEAVSESPPIATSNARYPGGDPAMYKFIEKKKNYTAAMKAQNLADNVVVSFTVESTGRISDPEIQKSVNGLLDEDALRVVRSMDKWEPATENGFPVKSTRTIVIKYQLEE